MWYVDRFPYRDSSFGAILLAGATIHTILGLGKSQKESEEGGKKHHLSCCGGRLFFRYYKIHVIEHLIVD